MSRVLFQSLSARIVLLAACLIMGTVGRIPPAAGQDAASGKQIPFDIPAQPLADALVAFSAASGFEVYYDGSLALGRRSASVRGLFTPLRGLETLLGGTGYAPRATGPDMFTIGPVMRAALPAQPSEALIRLYEAYLAILQTRIEDALCSLDTGQPNQVLFTFSVTAGGVISRAETLGSSGDPARDAAVSNRIRGLSIGEPAPAGLPQPITMVIYPPAVGEAPGCASTAAHRTSR